MLRSVEPAQTEERADLHKQDEEHDHRAEILDAEGVEAVDVAIVAAVDLAVQGFRLDLPADHDGHEQGAERHGNAFGDHIHEVEPVSAPVSLGVDVEQVLRRDAVGAETVNRDEAGQQGDGEADDGEHLVAVT